LFVVKGIYRDDFVGEDDLCALQKGARFTDFAVFFLAGGGSHSDGASVFLAAQRHDHSAFAIADGFAVQGEALGETALVLLQPTGEGFGVGVGVDFVQEVVESVVAGHFEPPAAVLFAHPQPDGFAVAFAQGGDFVVNAAHVSAAHEQAQGDQGEHRAEGVAAALGAARVGDFEEGAAEAFQVIDFERAAFSAGADVRFFAFFGKLRGAHEGVSLGVQGVEPELFWSAIGFVIIVGGVGIADLGKAFGVSGKLPVGDFVNGPGMALGIAEAFR